MDKRIYDAWKDEGLVVWAIGDDTEDAIRQFDEQLDLGLPVLLDTDGAVHDLYDEIWPYRQQAYPQQWILDRDGKVAYVAYDFDYDDVVAVIEQVLAED